MKNKYHVLLLLLFVLMILPTLLFQTSSAMAGEIGQFIYENLELEIDSDVSFYYDSRAEKVNLKYPGVRIGIGHKNFEDIINNFGFTSNEKVRFAFGIRIKLSSIPKLTKGMAYTDLVDGMNTKMAIIKEEMLPQMQAQTMQSVIDQMSGTYEQLPETYQNAIKENVYQEVENAIDQHIELIKKEKEEMITDRQGQIIKDETFQEFLLVGAGYAEGLDGLFLFKAGKGKIPSSAHMDYNGDTELDKLRNIENIHGVMGVANTGMIQAGFIKQAGNKGQLRVDFAFYHDRLECESFSQYMANSMGIDEEVFDDYMQIERLDSYMVRLLLRKPRYEIYVSALKTYNGREKTRYSTGAIFRITHNDRILIDFYKGNGDDLLTGKAASAFYSRKIKLIKLLDVDLYTGVEFYRDKKDYRWDMDLNEPGRNYTDYVAGVSAKTKKYNFFKGFVKAGLSGMVEYLIRDSRDETFPLNNDDEAYRFQIGVSGVFGKRSTNKTPINDLLKDIF